MVLLEKKTKRQDIGAEKWRDNKGIGTLFWITAMGKTFAALDRITNKMFVRLPNLTVIVIAPSVAVRDQWNKEIKNICTQHVNNFRVHTIGYIQENRLDIVCDLLILDEIHEYYTEDRFNYIYNAKSKFILGLTSTFKDVNNRYKLMQTICPVVDVISEEEAVREGYIANFLEFNIPTVLTDTEQARYKEATDAISKYLPRFGNKEALSIAQGVLSGGTYDGVKYKAMDYAIGWAIRQGWRNNLNLRNPAEAQINMQWNPKVIIGYAKLLMNAIRERKNLIYNAENKLTLACNIVKKFNDIKFICFSQSTQFADLLCEKINRETTSDTCLAYHSNLETQMLPVGKNGKLIKVGKDRLKKITIEKILNGNVRGISTASALDRGLNVDDLRLGISSSGTQNPTQQKQRGGRLKRLEIYNPHHIALIVNLYIKNSKDEIWLKNRQQDAEHEIYWVNSIDEINYTPLANDSFTLEDLE